MPDAHPQQVYALLRTLRDYTFSPEYRAQFAKWFNDKTGAVKRAEPDPNQDAWARYCLDNGLAGYEEWCGGQALTITDRGRLALLLHGQVPLPATDGKQPIPTPEPRTIVYHGGESYSAGGEARCVTQQYHDLLQAFLKTARPMKTTELERICSNPSKVVKQLKQWFPDAVEMPGKDKGKGYLVRVRAAVGNG